LRGLTFYKRWSIEQKGLGVLILGLLIFDNPFYNTLGDYVAAVLVLQLAVALVFYYALYFRRICCRRKSEERLENLARRIIFLLVTAPVLILGVVGALLYGFFLWKDSLNIWVKYLGCFSLCNWTIYLLGFFYTPATITCRRGAPQYAVELTRFPNSGSIVLEI